jgi:glycine cleavage system H protein
LFIKGNEPMMIDPEARYTKSHEWARKEGAVISVGITAYAIEQLGDIVFMELPGAGKVLNQGDSFGVVESVKSASDMYAPIGGKVAEVNTAIPDNPDSLKQDAYQKGWLVKIQPSNAAELEGLMDADAYRKFLETEA